LIIVEQADRLIDIETTNGMERLRKTSLSIPYLFCIVIKSSLALNVPVEF